MEFISAEEFLEQPKEVQIVLLDWFNNNMSYYDLVQNGIEIMLYRDYFRRININSDSYPLFTECNLREFIEDVTECQLDISSTDYLSYCLTLKNDKGKYFKRFESLGTDLLQAYWKVACEIAKESVENE